MSGVKFSKKSAERVAAVTKRVEAMPRGEHQIRRGNITGTLVAYFILNDPLAAATDSLTGAAVAQATFYASDPDNPAVMAAGQTTYTPQELATSSPARVEWVVNRSLDLAANADAGGMAVFVNGEWLVFWVDCTAGA
jgi:hypothetical protein